jgi:hypothetical protein
MKGSNPSGSEGLVKTFNGDTSISPSPVLNGSFGEDISKLNEKLSKE